MTSLGGDIVNRVRRLPKPAQATVALQPLFEAVSNAIHAVEDLYLGESVQKGRIGVTITNLKDSDKVRIIVSDNGVGLDTKRFDAFCMTDTDYKLERGGKGIGRLMWLDAFESIKVVSVFKQSSVPRKREFVFQLHKTDQITDEKMSEMPSGTPTGTIITFNGIRGAYRKPFPVRPKVLIRHFGSHFLADFIMQKSARVDVVIDGSNTVFPDAITALLVEDRGEQNVGSEIFGDLKVASFICRKVASADFDGDHQLHFIANGRTVLTRKIDGLIGIGRFGADRSCVYHGCVSGQYLDDRVNQERTNFNFGEDVVEQIAKECANNIREAALKGEIEEFDGGRLVTMKEFLNEYPSFQFENAEQLIKRTPKNAVKAEQFAQALIPTRIRRDQERNKTVQGLISTLASASGVPENFGESVRKAADDVRAEEQRQLTEYVMRRKMVLDVLDLLIKRVRETESGQDDYHLENTLHQFICPMKVRGDDPKKVELADHELWIIDERLAFTKYFASDVPISSLIQKSDSNERSDILVFDKIHGLGLKEQEPLSRVMLVEFKKPGLKKYEENYSPLNQISRYLNQIVSGKVETFDASHLRVTDDCVFYCYVIADIVGALDIHTSAWQTTANGRGRWTPLSGKYRGSIEVIEWVDLIKDARMRNASFIHAAGMPINLSGV